MSVEENIDSLFEEAKSDASGIIGEHTIPKEVPQADYELDYDEMSELDEITENEVVKKECTDVVELSDDVSIQNQNYIDKNVKEIISHNMGLMEKLRNDVDKPEYTNVKHRIMEVHSSLTNSVAMLLRELRELSKMRIGIDVIPYAEAIRNKLDKDNDKNDKKGITLSSSQLLKLINDAKRSNEIDAEKIEFEEVKSDKEQTN